MFRQSIKDIVTSQFYDVSGLFLLCVSFNLVCWIAASECIAMPRFTEIKEIGIQYNDLPKENNKNYENIYV